ncbi:MAG TPA: hypothetical protein ENN63_12655 [Bacteroidetes bacterium]|nr:hypothetical protein [Bacteroidota bacterium]
MKTILLSAFTLILISLCSSCKKNDNENHDGPKIYTVHIDPAVTFQKMVGFGGSLTWYSDRIITSPYKNQICQLLFEDLGTDIIRLKNWYYPAGYPVEKSPDVMESSGIKTLFGTTNQLHQLAMHYNPNILTLLSSWSPPSALKSNNNLNNGTLKKQDGVFMYEAFADYWVDVLDHIPFNPEYLSIQNEPTWVTDSWETCAWRPVEMDGFPSYETAFDLVYDRISKRTDPPGLIGPESANIGTSAFGGNTFGVFCNVLKDKPYLNMYGFHTYNFSAETPLAETKPLLNMIRDEYGNKPSVMTEFSAFPWMKTAQYMIQVINEAHASGYIYWEMVWAETNSKAMIQIDQAGNYTITPFFHVMKHFAGNIDHEYVRVDASMEITSVYHTAFLDPGGHSITLVMVNPLTTDVRVNFSVNDKSITAVKAIQSEEDNFYRELPDLAPGSHVVLKPESVTTVILDVE